MPVQSAHSFQLAAIRRPAGHTLAGRRAGGEPAPEPGF